MSKAAKSGGDGSSSTSKEVDLYEFLKVSKSATNTEIRKAYYALARIVHPDKNPNDPNAEENFKALQKAYNILKDPRKRERYDRTGCSDEESEAFWDAYEKYRGIKISAKDIEEFEKSYRNSKDEQADLVNYFNAHKGNIRTILGSIIASTNDDRSRYVKFFQTALDDPKDARLDKQFREAFDQSKTQIATEEELDEAEEDIGEDEDDQEKEEEEADDEDDDDSFIAPEGEEEEEDSEEDEESSRPLFSKGEGVLARWRNGRKYYAGEILKVRDDGTYDIIYDRDQVVEEGVKAHLVKINNQKREVRPNPAGGSATAAEKTKEKENTAGPTKKRRRAAKKSKPDDSEYGDLDALRAAMLGGSRAKARAAGFEAFAQKYSK